MSDSTTTTDQTDAKIVTPLKTVLLSVKGLGESTIVKALDEAEVDGDAIATPEQLARAATVEKDREGLKGKARALYVITGNGSEQQAAAARAKAELANAGKDDKGKGKGKGSTPAASSSDFDWPKKPAEILLDYLKAEVTSDQNAPNRGAPFIDAKGILRFTGTHWREWLASQGMNPGKNQAGEPVREAGMKMRPFALPGENRQLGFYTGPAPRGTANLPRRIVERAARQPGSGGGGRKANPYSKFTDAQYALVRELILKAPKRLHGDARTELIALLPDVPPADEPVVQPDEVEPPAEVRAQQDTEQEDTGAPSSDTRTDEGRDDEPTSDES